MRVAVCGCNCCRLATVAAVAARSAWVAKIGIVVDPGDAPAPQSEANVNDAPGTVRVRTPSFDRIVCDETSNPKNALEDNTNKNIL